MKSISVVIPTYNRAEIVLDTVQLLLKQTYPISDILIVDQTHYPSSSRLANRLHKLHQNGSINWIRLEEPSIPAAMNVGLQRANSDYVLFLDDDSSFDDGLLQSYADYIEKFQPVAVSGQVLQPGESPEAMSEDYQSGYGLYEDLDFRFRSNQEHRVNNCMAGNLLVDRKSAILCGGFDEQFSGVAYRFETEFCRRLVDFAEEKILFGPRASINHLKLSTGGTRSSVPNFLTSSSPIHSQGDYYFAMRQARGWPRIKYIAHRYLTAPKAKMYVKNPWYLIPRMVGETRGLLLALKLYRSGPKLIDKNFQRYM